TGFSRDWSSDVCSSDLERLVVFLGDLNHLPTLLGRDAHGLFDEDVGTVLHGIDADGRMVLVAGEDDDGVWFFVLQHLHVVGIPKIGRASCRERGWIAGV